MTGPQDPFDDFPEVVPAGPTPTGLPSGPEEPVAYDTGSDAWWRAQAAAQRAAAEQEAPAPPEVPEAPAPTYVAPPPTPPAPTPPAPSPLDATWYPEILAPAMPPAAGPPAALPPQPEPEPEPEPIWPATPAEADLEPAPDASYAADVTRERPDPPSTPVGPLQAAAGAGLAVLGVALAVGALFVFNSRDETAGPALVVPSQLNVTAAPPTAATSPPTSVSTTAPSPTTLPTAAPVAPVVPVSVLNNSRIKNLAKASAARFSAGGWPIATQGNYRGGIIATTTVYYAEGQRASAERFARQFGIPRVAPRFAGLPTTGMTVVVTRDYQ